LVDDQGNDLAYCDLALVPSSSDVGHQNADEDPVCPEEFNTVSPMALKERYREWARENLANDDLEFDDKASVNLCEAGAFVQAWVWVPFSRLPVQTDSAD
jgi:hypothetical protein